MSQQAEKMKKDTSEKKESSTASEAHSDDLFVYDEEMHKRICDEKPWTKDPHFFKHVKISANALVKMVMHARSGGAIEVMGIMLGKVMDGGVMVVTDAFALPVEGTETRVNAGAEAFEYMVNYIEQTRQVGRKENAIGWYHSHPGYGCWLSGIDVNTQLLNQTYQEPWVAIVIDPVRTISSGKVEIGAFRTYPKDYTPPDSAGAGEYQRVPMSKIEDFGVHSKCYYKLETSFFKSSLDSKLLDLLWNKYWVNTLSSSPFLNNRGYLSGQIDDLSEKIDRLAASSFTRGGMMDPGSVPSKKEDSEMSKLEKDSVEVSQEQLHGLISQVMKDILFNPRMKEFSQ